MSCETQVHSSKRSRTEKSCDNYRNQRRRLNNNDDDEIINSELASINDTKTKTPNFKFSTPIDEEKLFFSWKRDSFAEGSCRRAFAGRVNKGPKKGMRIVVKKWKDKHVFEKDFWDQEILTHQKAKELIDKWNELKLISKKYQTHVPFKMICCTSSHKLGGKGPVVDEWLIGEEYLEGSWEKWNSNSGYVHMPSASIQAFCHWTYHYSNGELLMCDVQGVRSEDTYHITDPCIVSKSQKYGLTDVGQCGIDTFFATHRCNEFCDPKWAKPKYILTANILAKKMTTTYRWQTNKNE